MASPFLTAAAVLALATDPACGGLPPGSEIAIRATAVSTHESSRDPLTINVNGPAGGTRRFQTRAEAEAFARRLEAQGRDFDAGLMQINRRQFARHGLTIETVFEPCRNMAAGVAHLIGDLDAVWRAAHSRYNTGDPQRGIANGYVANIERALETVRRELSQPAPPAPAPAPPPSETPPSPECRVPHWDVWAHCRSGTQRPPWLRERPEPDPAGLEAAATPSVQCAASSRGSKTHDLTPFHACGGGAPARRTPGLA